MRDALGVNRSSRNGQGRKQQCFVGAYSVSEMNEQMAFTGWESFGGKILRGPTSIISVSGTGSQIQVILCTCHRCQAYSLLVNLVLSNPEYE